MATDPEFMSRQVRSARRFYRDLRQGRRPGLTVVCAGYEPCTADYVMRRPSFPWYGIELVGDGGGRLELAGQPAPLVPGLVFTYGPGVPHAIFADPARPPRKWFLDLAGDEVPELLTAVGLAPGTAGLITAPAPARALFDLLVDTGRRAGPETDALLAALARALLLALGHPSRSAASGDAAAQATYLRCRTWLEEHAASGAGVQESGAALDLAPAYISRLFQRFDRVTPGAYCRRLRLQQAADRLVGTSDQVQEIAEASGYADAFHFSRAFSREFGVSPTAFRALSRPAEASE
jgi:AraC-like DNA-binding protein